MKKRFWLPLLLALLMLFSASCQKEQTEKEQEKQKEHAQQEKEPALTALPSGKERIDYLQNHSAEEIDSYNRQIYALLDKSSPQEIYDGLKKEMEAWAKEVNTVTFTQVDGTFSHDPLLMWENENRRQYQNITASIKLTYDPASLSGDADRQLKELLQQAEKAFRSSPYSLKVSTLSLALFDEKTGYPSATADNLGIASGAKDSPTLPLSQEELALQTIAYDQVSAFCKREFSGKAFENMPLPNVALSHFGLLPGSPVLECRIRIYEQNDQDPQAFAQKLKGLAHELTDQWTKEEKALQALGVTNVRITIDLRYSGEKPLVFEIPLAAA